MNSRKWLILLNGLGLTAFIFGLLIWGHSVAIELTQPRWLHDTLTHFPFPPLSWRVDTTGIVGFVAAAFGFLAWFLSRNYLRIGQPAS
jgi:type IV secretory pathway TrbD component